MPWEAFRKKDVELFKIAVSYGADINTLSECDNVMKTILHEAIGEGELQWFQMIVGFGADLNIRDSLGETIGKSISYHPMSLRNTYVMSVSSSCYLK